MVQAQQETRLAGPILQFLGQPVGLRNGGATAFVWGLLSAASVAASAYHGSKRHGGSIGWGIAWGALGGLFPVLTPAIGAAQGYGKCKYDCGGVKGPRRYRRVLRGPVSVWG